jgi:hypothetical protein
MQACLDGSTYNTKQEGEHQDGAQRHNNPKAKYIERERTNPKRTASERKDLRRERKSRREQARAGESRRERALERGAPPGLRRGSVATMVRGVRDLQRESGIFVAP